MRPRVTVVVTQRERMSLTQRSLESVLSDHSEPFELIYVDGGAPAKVRAYLEAKSAEANFKLIQRPDWLWPNVARNLALQHVETEYVVFIDNDVLVERGWLQKLVCAADETDAALVGPLYLWSDGRSTPRIHMAGGLLNVETTERGLEIFERHNLINQSIDVRKGLDRAPCDFLEYHCMLVRTGFLKALGGLQEEIVCVHEHIDLALEARKRNLPIIMEPASGVDYLAFVPYAVSDLPFYQWRWSESAVRQSLDAFCKKWNCVENGNALKDVHQFAEKHRDAGSSRELNVIARAFSQGLVARDIQQTPFGLLKQAFARGYSQSDLLLIGKAYHAASSLFGDGYRPCGRPFVLHLIGTASVLVSFGFSMRVIVFGLLHAAYTHAPVGHAAHASLDAVKRMLTSQFGEPVEQLVREYTRFQCNPKAWCDARPLDCLTMHDAEVIALALANGIDEHAAGEFLFASKPASSGAWLAYAREVADLLRVPELAESLAAIASTPLPDGFMVRLKSNGSFRQQQGRSVPMAHAHFRTWDANRQGKDGGDAPSVRLVG